MMSKEAGTCHQDVLEAFNICKVRVQVDEKHQKHRGHVLCRLEERGTREGGGVGGTAGTPWAESASKVPGTELSKAQRKGT